MRDFNKNLDPMAYFNTYAKIISNVTIIRNKTDRFRYLVFPGPKNKRYFIFSCGLTENSECDVPKTLIFCSRFKIAKRLQQTYIYLSLFLCR